MAIPTVISFGKGVVFLGDGEAVETFTKVCGFNAMTITLEKDTNDVVVPDCDDPDAAPWKGTDVASLGWSASFEGVFTKESDPLIWDAVNTSVSRNLRFRLIGAGSGGATPDLQFTGKGHMVYELSGTRGEKWTNTVEVTGDGPLARASVAAL